MDKALGGLDGKTVNIGARNDLYGTGFEEALAAELEGRGATVGESVIYDPEQPSYNSEAAQITSGNPDAYRDHRLPGDLCQGRPGAGPHRQLGSRTSRSSPTASPRPTCRATSARRRRKACSGSLPARSPGDAPDAFDKLYTRRRRTGAQTVRRAELRRRDALLPGSGRRRVDGGRGHRRERSPTSPRPPGKKYTLEQLPQAIEALQNGEDIDYEGASGPIDLDENGDLSRYVYDISEFRGGKLVKLETVEVVSRRVDERRGSRRH